MYILGISGHHRDAAAALLKGGRVVAAMEEQKLARVMHIGLRESGGLPYEAIGYCLKAAGIGIEDVDLVTYYLRPRRLLNRQLEYAERQAAANDRAAGDLEAACVSEFHDRMKTLNLAQRLLGDRSKVVAVDHQLAHAAGSFYTSGFDRAAVMVLGGRGDHISIALGIGEGNRIRLLTRIEFPQSLGWIYSQLTEYLGYRANEGEHMTQWLSVTGEPEFLGAFEEMMKVDHAGMPAFDMDYFSPWPGGPDPFTEKFYRRFGDQLRRKDHRLNSMSKTATWAELTEDLAGRPKSALPVTSYRRNLAHSLQRRLEEVVLGLAEKMRREHRLDSLCLAGGVASNNLLISRLERESGFDHVYVQPAAGNAGCSLGSALFHWHHRMGRGGAQRLGSVFLGPGYNDEEIKPVIDNCKLTSRYHTSDNKLVDEAVDLLARNNILAWFQGRAEFGPRSLGARSILASPLHGFMKENLNIFVKHREATRPFAASVQEERAAEFFDNVGPLSKFMMTVSRVREDKRDLIPSAYFADGLARVHTVSRADNPIFWQLLERFGEKTGIPVLLNTSFNLFGEALVCTPREAIRSFYCSGIDALALNRFLIRK